MFPLLAAGLDPWIGPRLAFNQQESGVATMNVLEQKHGFDGRSDRIGRKFVVREDSKTQAANAIASGSARS
jgi:hypothetical protein